MNKIKLRELLEAVVVCVTLPSGVVVPVCLLFKVFTLEQLFNWWMGWYGPFYSCFILAGTLYLIVLFLYGLWQTPLGRFLLTEATKLWFRLHS